MAAQFTLDDTALAIVRVLAGECPRGGQAGVHYAANNHGYPYKPVCGCGWTDWGYVAEHAAAGMAMAHRDDTL